MKIYQIEHYDYDEHGNHGLFIDREVAERIAANMDILEGHKRGYIVEEYELDDRSALTLSEKAVKAWYIVTETRVTFHSFDFPPEEGLEKYHPTYRNDILQHPVYVLARDPLEAKELGKPLLAQRNREKRELLSAREEDWIRHLKHQ